MTSDRPPPPRRAGHSRAPRARDQRSAACPASIAVNFRWGGDATARMAKTLDEALGRGKAADASAPANLAQGKCRRQPGRPRRTMAILARAQREASVMGRANRRTRRNYPPAAAQADQKRQTVWAGHDPPSLL